MADFQIENFDKLPDTALISAKQLMLLSGRSRTSLWRDVLNEDLGGPVKIGARTVKWTAKEVRRYLRGGSKMTFNVPGIEKHHSPLDQEGNVHNEAKQNNHLSIDDDEIPF